MSKVQKKIIESSGFYLLSVYSGVIFGFFSTFLIARLITPIEWGYLLFAQSYLSMAMTICVFFPPAAESSILFYIPNFIIKKGKLSSEIRRFFFHIYKIRLIGIIIVYVIFLITLNFTNFNLEVNQLILIISPMIIFNVISNLNNAFLLAFQKYKLVFIINLINSLLYTSLVILIFLLNLQNTLILLAYITLFSSIVSCFISIFLIIPLIPKKKKKNLILKYQTQDNFFKIHKNYGINLVIESLFSHLTTLILNLLFLNSGFLVFITYFAICENTVKFALNFSISNRNIYISIFSEIYFRKKYEIFKRSFYQLLKYLLLIAFFIIGILFFFIEIYITVLYSEKYIIIKFAIQFFLFTAIFRLIIRNLLIIAQSTNNTRINTEMALFRTFFILIFVIIGISFKNFTLLVILYIFSLFLLSIVLIYLVNKRINFRLNIFKIFKPIIMFIVSILISYIISFLINFQILVNNPLFNLIFNNTLRLIIFFIIFYLALFLTKFITKEEFNQLINIFPIIKSNNHIIQKIINLIKSLLPSDKNN